MGFTEEFTKKIHCPHCKESFDATVSYEANVSVVLGSEGHMPTEILARRGDDTAKSRPITAGEHFTAQLDPAQELAWKMAEESGMGEAFGKAFQHAHGTVPNNIPKAFFGWLRLAKPKMIPREVMQVFKDEFGGSISFVAHQSVGAVMSNGEVVNFLPCQTVGLSGASGVRLSQTGGQLARTAEQWIRTKYGYVARSGAMLDTMRKKSYGEFCNPVL
jgi:hypothetical protein